mmetsp:Transcript_64074/g.149207  ORF Transcript_64074/g.149207 Transcript_64074/m.149207 type:complete len:313 (+) Transcript_64074:42-980(+)
MASDQGSLRLLNPLVIRFSQPRIAPHFRDGHLLDETCAEVYDAPLEGCGASPVLMGAGRPQYDAVLLPPFPPIRVISWLPKLRRPDGEAERDEHGDQKLGKRAWFALDNRRLHSMQYAAAQRWPRRCCAVVRCIEEVPGTTVRELRKFRTTTEGRSVEVGVRTGQTQLWTWQQAAPPGVRTDGPEAEGLFAEDLWDAAVWAPQACAAAAALAAERAHLAEEDPGSPGGRGSPGDSCRGQLVRCPDEGWQYVDPAGRTQGPFGLEKMRLWYQHGFFYPDLPMRCDVGDAFRPFRELFPATAVPFKDPVVRYRL